MTSQSRYLRHPHLFFFTIGTLGFLYFPLIVLAVFSFNQSRLMTDWQGFTTLWYGQLAHDVKLIRSLTNSIQVAIWTTILSLILGVPCGILLSRSSKRAGIFLELLVLLPLIVPEIVLAIAFAALFGFLSVRFGFFTIVASHVAFSLSYVVLLIRARMARMDHNLIEAAMDLAATETTVLLRVILPYLMPSILSSTLLVFTVSLDDYVITSFVAGVGTTTLPLHIYSMTKEGLSPEINAICTALLVLTGLVVMVVHFLQNLQFEWKKVLPWGLLCLCLLCAPTVWRHWAFKGEQPVPMNLFIWSGYLAPNTIREFGQRFNAQVEVDLYDSNEALLAKLQAGNTGYDVVVPGDYCVQLLKKRGLLRQMDLEKIPNLNRNIDSRFLNKPFDQGNHYSIPYIWGVTGIGYRKDLVPQQLVGWADLWTESCRGRILVLDDMRENFGAALKRLGYSINSRDLAQLREAKQLLEIQKPLLLAYNSSNFQEILASGDAWMAQAWNGQIAKVARDHPNIEFCWPKEGTTLFIDSFCIPRDSAHVEMAHQFINYMLEAETAAAIMNHTGYSLANKSALAFVESSLMQNPAFTPDPAYLEKCEMLQDVEDAILTYDRLWTELKAR